MRKHNILFIALILSSFIINAQKQIKLSFNGLGEINSGVKIQAWKKGQEYNIGKDTVINGKTSINIPDSVKPGMISIHFTDNAPIPEFRLIHSSENQNITITPDAKMRRLIIGGDGETAKYYTNRHITDSITERIMNFRKIAEAYNENDYFGLLTYNHWQLELEVLDRVFEKINSLNKESIFLNYLNANRYYIVENWIDENLIRKKVSEHFFDYFDPLDITLSKSPILASKIDDYLSLAAGIPEGLREDNIKKAVDNYMLKISASEEVTAYSAMIMRRWLNKYGFETIMEYIDIQYLSTQCDAGLDYNLQERLEAYKRLAPGNPAPEVAWIGSNNSIYVLSEIKADKKVVVFWATWCPHCGEIMPRIYSHLADKPNIKVLTIGLDEDEGEWTKKITSFPGWFHLRAQDKWQNETVKLFAVSATPVMFIIDGNNKIQRKVSNYEDFVFEISK